MLRKSLKEFILEQVELYLNEDNPVRETKKDKFFGLFSSSGEKGRLRAIAFRDQFLFDAKYTEDGGEYQLKKDLWTILSQANGNAIFSLGSSEQFQIRLLTGLCFYLGFSADDIQYSQTRYALSMASAQTGYINGSYVRIQSMLSLLKEKMNAPYQEMTERPSLKQ